MKKNILFVTTSKIDTIQSKGLYTDLIRKLSVHANVYVLSSVEKRYANAIENDVIEENVRIVRCQIGNLTKTRRLEKLITFLTLNDKFARTYINKLSSIKYDLVLYATPPIMLYSLIKSIKWKSKAKTYLMLKDIFPQNAVDLQMLSKLNPLYYYFRNKEKKLYRISDRIGCMSQANVEYLLKHNQYIENSKVEVFPNSMELCDKELTIDKTIIRQKYDLPLDKSVFIYGGNIGKPQGVDFIKKCILKNEENLNSYFLFVGSGTEFGPIKKFILENSIKNSFSMDQLSRVDFDILLLACDVGLVFLDYRFTIPNFPSRILSYLNAQLPILAATDSSTDLRLIIEDYNVGLWTSSTNINQFNKFVNLMSSVSLEDYKKNSIVLLKDKYNIEDSVKKIMKFINEWSE